jgi:hypothetical protein
MRSCTRIFFRVRSGRTQMEVAVLRCQPYADVDYLGTPCLEGVGRATKPESN